MALLSQHRAHLRTARSWQCALAVASLAAFAATQASCATGTSETAASCSADDDLDGDSLSGCGDPDCHRFAHCRVSSALAPDASDPDPGGQGGTAGPDTPTGGTGGMMMSGGEDGGGPIVEDSGVDADASNCDCQADEICTDAGCEPVVDPDPVYTLRMISAESPRGRPGPPPDGTCVEIACPEGGGSPVAYCPCEPEPYVRVVLIRAPAELDPTETNLLDTIVQGAQLSVMFGEDEKVDVELKPGDKLRFELWDKNVVAADMLVYTCEPDLHDLEPGPIECSVKSGTLGDTPYWIRATLDFAQ